MISACSSGAKVKVDRYKVSGILIRFFCYLLKELKLKIDQAG